MTHVQNTHEEGDDHAVTKLPAQDLERASAFYRDKLGLADFWHPF